MSQSNAQNPGSKGSPTPAVKAEPANTHAEYSAETIKGIYEFLKHTPEGSVRKMLCNGDLTDGHFRLLMKLVKGGPDNDFVEAFNNNDMGKLRLNPKEAPLKDGFWKIVKAHLSSTGLLPTGKAA